MPIQMPMKEPRNHAKAFHPRQGLPDLLGAQFGIVDPVGLERRLKKVDHRRQGIVADQEDHDVGAGEDLELAEGEAVIAKDRVRPDDRHKHPETGRN